MTAIATDAARPKITAVTCVKNEGPFLLEWIAFNRVIGVTDFLFYSNDCTDGTDRLLDEQGRVFSAEGLSMMGGVPQFEAGEARVPQAIAFYTAIRPDLQGLGLDLTELRISRRGSIETVLSNGIEVIVGSTDQADRWRRFMVGLRPLMEQSATPIARIDLRYTNGFAVLPYSPDQAPADPAGAPPEQASTGDA